MARFLRYEPCPRCTDSGRDRARDNLALYDDGSAHCFSCHYHRFPVGIRANISPEKEVNDSKVLPLDFTREIPSFAWEWLLQYGLSWKYWTPFVGWSEKDQRLVFTIGKPPAFSMGRYFGPEPTEGERKPRKWFVYGNCHREAHVFGWETEGRRAVLVEDVISAHKIGQVATCIPLFGTKIFDQVIPTLRHIGLPILMWLDRDQDQFAAKRAARLAMLTGFPVTYVSTEVDPKSLSLQKIGAIVNG